MFLQAVRDSRREHLEKFINHSFYLFIGGFVGYFGYHVIVLLQK